MTFNPTEIALVKLQRQSKDDEIFVFIAMSHEYLCNKLMYKQNNLNLSDVFYRMYRYISPARLVTVCSADDTETETKR